jgi:hypothetical protein
LSESRSCARLLLLRKILSKVTPEPSNEMAQVIFNVARHHNRGEISFCNNAW